jgi:predicted nucleic acid-binding Zn ribbon protein
MSKIEQKKKGTALPAKEQKRMTAQQILFAVIAIIIILAMIVPSIR